MLFLVRNKGKLPPPSVGGSRKVLEGGGGYIGVGSLEGNLSGALCLCGEVVTFKGGNEKPCLC